MEAIWDRLEAEAAAEGGRLNRGFPWWLRLVAGKGTLAITIGRQIYLASTLLTRGELEIESTVVHELEHVRQYARVGLVRFAWHYACDYARNRIRGMSAFEAYEAIPFEKEARIAEADHRRKRTTGEDVRTA